MPIKITPTLEVTINLKNAQEGDHLRVVFDKKGLSPLYLRVATNNYGHNVLTLPLELTPLDVYADIVKQVAQEFRANTPSYTHYLSDWYANLDETARSDQFTEALDATLTQSWVSESSLQVNRTLTVYFHLPFHGALYARGLLEWSSEAVVHTLETADEEEAQYAIGLIEMERTLREVHALKTPRNKR